MRTVLHMPFDPASRFIRIVMAEKGLPAQYIDTPPWEESDALSRANPALHIPVLQDAPIDAPGVNVAPVSVIIEYLEDAYREPALFPSTPAERAETRRLVAWFTEKFERDVIDLIVRERIDKRLMKRGQPDYDKLRAGLEALDWHMDYFTWLIDQRNWFAGPSLSVADFAAAAYLSSLDYVGAAPWERFPIVKEWYARIKSRPSFRPILRDRIDGLPPPRCYDDLDF
ncbi:MAG: glutathione S-transferase family protein [Pseudomonadota bacterium]